MMVFSGMRLVGVADKSFFAGQKRAGKKQGFFFQNPQHFILHDASMMEAPDKSRDG